MKTVTLIPPKPSFTVPFEDIVEIIKSVPAGRLTRYCDIEDIFKKFHSVEVVLIEYPSYERYLKLRLKQEKKSIFEIDTEQIFKDFSAIPWWRLVSKYGCISESDTVCPDMFKKQYLNDEGFKLVTYRGKEESQIENYKNYLVDYRLATNEKGEPVIEMLA